MTKYNYKITATTGNDKGAEAGRGVYVHIIGDNGTLHRQPAHINSSKKGGEGTDTVKASSKDGTKGDIGRTHSIVMEIPSDAGGGWQFSKVVVERFRDDEPLDTAVFSGFTPMWLDSNTGPLCVTLDKPNRS